MIEGRNTAILSRHDEWSIKRGLGIGVNFWGGLGHDSQCRINDSIDGSVSVDLGSQDLGTATRTMIAMVAAETFGARNRTGFHRPRRHEFPPSGGSGGSTTIGGVSVSTRPKPRSTRSEDFRSALAHLGVPADQLEAVDGRIRQIRNPDKGMSWKQACAKLGTQTISEMGENLSRTPEGRADQPGRFRRADGRRHVE